MPLRSLDMRGRCVAGAGDVTTCWTMGRCTAFQVIRCPDAGAPATARCRFSNPSAISIAVGDAVSNAGG
eukprot:366501-Chlamydomonas_euryale.AAC.42